MKKICLVVLALVLATTLIFSACSQTTTEPAKTSAPAATAQAPASSAAQPSAPEKVYTIRWADMDQEQSWTTIHSTKPYMDAVEEATGGRVKFEPYWGNTLSKQTENWEALKSGIADAAVCVMAFWPGLAPLSDVVSLPFIGFESAEHAGAVLGKLYETFPAIQEEYKDVHVLFIPAGDPYVLQTSKKQVKTLEDVKGMKIRALGGPQTTYLQAVGASPVMVGMVDVYMNLQKGVLDGVLASWASVESMKFHEVAKYITNVPCSVPFAARAMNLEVWNSLPADVQEAINSVSGFERGVEFSRTQYDEHVAHVKAAGYDVVEYTPPLEEIARWQEFARPIWQDWVSEMEAAGHPEAQEILDKTLELVEVYRK
ncbi:MAG: TRAP transporter substrate-binding protein [Dehalococcoidales bacterium]|nr:TRAP transporter substrate-binding protein [Dehalococcoidales bacterium]